MRHTLALLLALSGCATGGTVAPAPPYSAADEQLYEARAARYRTSVQTAGRATDEEHIDPVPGVTVPKPLPVVSGVLSPEAGALAIEYVAARRSSALLVWVGGGLAVDHRGPGFGADAPLVSKAMAKPVATMAIGRALQLGHIRSVDQPVADYVREWRRDPQKRRISIRHLLEMRSGLLPQDFGADAPAVLDRAYLHPRHDSVLVHEYPLTDEPGARFEYSNANSELIALVIERATGQRYANFIGEQLLMPIGAAGGTVRLDRDRGLAHSGCCLSLPAQSWMRLGLLLLEGGMHQGKRLLPADFVRDMKTGTAQNPHFGMGLWVAGPYLARRGYLRPGQPLGAVLHSEPYLDADISLFDGNGHQVMYLVPSQQMIILRMGEFPKTGLEWDNSYLPNLLIADAAERAHRDLPMPQSREIRQ